MLLSGTLVAGGTLLATAKLYREQKRRKETPWTVYAEKIAKKKPLFVKSQNPLLRQPRPSKIASARAAYQKFSETQIKPLFVSQRDEQLAEMRGDREDEINEAERENDRYLAYASSSLAVTTVAALTYPSLAILSLPPLLFITSRFFKFTINSIVNRKFDSVSIMDMIAALGPLLTGHFLAASLGETLTFSSRKLLLKTEDHSRQSLLHVFGEQPRFIWIERDEVEVEMAFEELSYGDTVIMDAGQTIPIDGTIISGVGTIDQRALTGESQPVEKGVGDHVLAGTILLSGRLYIQVEKTGADTVAAQIGDILNASADFKSSVQSRGQKIVHQGAVPTLALSALTLPFLGVQSALAMLFAGFGYHMRVAAPISVLNFLRITSENGILVKDGRSLELLSEIDTVVFDKTGTLTEDVPTIGTIYIMPCGYTSAEYSQNDLLTFAAAAEYKQTHPIALAITKEANKRELTLPKIKDAAYELGYGLKVHLTTEIRGEQVIRVGSGRFMEMCDITIPATYQEIEERCHAEGHSLVYVAIDNQLGGAIELVPTIRPESFEITNELRKRGISMVIISGDHQKPTEKLAQSLGIDHYFAEVLPQDKASIIEQLQKDGTPGKLRRKSVCFIGDGINDSIALKTAHVGISMRGASTIATDTASIIFMDGSLKQLIPLLDIASELDANLTRSTIMTIVPGIVCVGGVFFFHFGLLSSIMLYNLGLVASVSNALLPLIKHEREKSK